jgi:hypothetical protein
MVLLVKLFAEDPVGVGSGSRLSSGNSLPSGDVHVGEPFMVIRYGNPNGQFRDNLTVLPVEGVAATPVRSRSGTRPSTVNSPRLEDDHAPATEEGEVESLTSPYSWRRLGRDSSQPFLSFVRAQCFAIINFEKARQNSFGYHAHKKRLYANIHLSLHQ